MTDSARSTWILTGLSGAGRSTAVRALAGAGVDVVDNLPVRLLEGFAALPRQTPGVAVVDARHGELLRGLIPPPGVGVIYLDCREDVLVKRLAESTAPHPLASAGGGLASVRAERELLTDLRAAADTVIDTTELPERELAARVVELVRPGGAVAPPFSVTVSSFGFKHGPQVEANWVVDVRFLRNPFWNPQLRPLTGCDPGVRDDVMSDPRSGELCDRLEKLLGWTCEQYAEHGRRRLHVAIGCTGGRHRSVVIAEELGRRLASETLPVTVRHRDVDKPDPR